MGFKVAPVAAGELLCQDEEAGCALLQTQDDVLRDALSDFEVPLMDTDLETVVVIFQPRHEVVLHPFGVG